MEMVSVPKMLLEEVANELAIEMLLLPDREQPKDLLYKVSCELGIFPLNPEA